MRVSDYFNCGKWPLFITNTLNVDFIPIVCNQIAILSATKKTLATYKEVVRISQITLLSPQIGREYQNL
jgi:hypothetical protein